jgi:hypothetical protein
VCKKDRAKREARKRRRAEKSEKRGQTALAAREIRADSQLGFSLSAIVDRGGAVLDVVEGNMERRLSDALLELVKPYVSFPPAPNELHLFEAALRGGADIWNATLIDDEVERVSALSKIGCERARLAGYPDEEGIRFVRELAARKIELYPHDKRQVMNVGVEPRGKTVLITAVGATRQKSTPRAQFSPS